MSKYCKYLSVISIIFWIVCLFWTGYGFEKSFTFRLAYGESLVAALSPEITAEYPPEEYIIGIGEMAKTGDAHKDKTLTEILARLEIARQIKVRVREKSLEFRCERGQGIQRGRSVQGALFSDEEECRNEFSMLIEETVDVFLEGSKIINHGERSGKIFAVAVLPRGQAAEGLDQGIGDSIKKTREYLQKAGKGDQDSLHKAQEEYLKAIVLEQTKEVILQGVKSRSSEAFESLEKELVNLQGK